MDAPFPEGMMPCIKQFFKEVHPTLKLGQHLYPEVFATRLFFPLQRQAELRKMMEIASKAGGLIGPRVVMEIGADKGGGLYHWCMGLPSVYMVIACEIRGLPYWEEFEKAFGNRMDFLWLPESSRGKGILGKKTATIEVVRRLRTTIDVLFLDGEKCAFSDDFDAYLPFMSKDGVVFFHDVKDDGEPSPMRNAWLRCRSLGFRTEEIVDISDVDKARKKLGINEALTTHDEWLLSWNGRSCGVGIVYMPKYGV